jgi:hypothetical protein
MKKKTRPTGGTQLPASPERGARGHSSLGRPKRRGVERKGQRPTYAGAGKQAAPTGLQAAREKVNGFLFFFYSFLSLFVYFPKPFQIKFSKPNQIKINPHHKIK